jgi:DNA modification methylase
MKFEEMINTIQLGDCYKLIKNIPDKSIDLVYIDIPYLYEEGGHEEKKSIVAKSIKKSHYESRLESITKGIDYSIFDELCRVMKYIYIYIYGVPGIKYWI